MKSNNKGPYGSFVQVCVTVNDLTQHPAASWCSNPSYEHFQKTFVSSLANRLTLMSGWLFTASFCTESAVISHNPHSLVWFAFILMGGMRLLMQWLVQRLQPGPRQIKWHIGSSGHLLVSSANTKPDNFFSASHIVLMKRRQASWRLESMSITDQWCSEKMPLWEEQGYYWGVL